MENVRSVFMAHSPMLRAPRFLKAVPLAAIITTIAALSACATTTPAATPLVVGEQATIAGEVIRVDTGPWSYDGHAVVSVATAAGTVNVQLPARWNLCKAPPPGDVQALKPHDRVEAVGTVTAADALMVCQQPQHHLRKLD